MDKREFSIFAAAMKTYFPREGLLPNDKAMELWFRQLQDIPYPIAEAALNKWVATQKWSPSIAEIRETAAAISSGELMDWGEAWESAIGAVRRYGYYRQSEALASLDDLTRRTVQRLGYTELCMSENITADRANFRMIYEQLANRKKADAQTPLQLSLLIERLRNEPERLEGRRRADEC